MWNPELYQRRHSFVWEKAAGLLQQLGPRPGERVLDLGCGTGQLTHQIACSGASVLGIDRSEEMIAEARRNFPDLDFQMLDACALSASAVFDAVFSNAVLHWIRDAAGVAERIAAALKPGGRFVAEFGGKGNVKQIVDAMQETAARLGAPNIETVRYNPSLGEYAALLERYGLAVEQAALFPRPTALEGEQGLRDWVHMFGGAYLERVPSQAREEFLTMLESDLRPKLWRDGVWYADYRRLRIFARKEVS